MHIVLCCRLLYRLNQEIFLKSFFVFYLFIYFFFSLSAKTGCQCFWNGRGWFARFPIGMPNHLKKQPFTQYKSNMVNNFLQFLLYKIIKTCAFLLVIRLWVDKFRVIQKQRFLYFFKTTGYFGFLAQYIKTQVYSKRPLCYGTLAQLAPTVRRAVC